MLSSEENNKLLSPILNANLQMESGYLVYTDILMHYIGILSQELPAEELLKLYQINKTWNHFLKRNHQATMKILNYSLTKKFPSDQIIEFKQFERKKESFINKMHSFFPLFIQENQSEDSRQKNLNWITCTLQEIKHEIQIKEIKEISKKTNLLQHIKETSNSEKENIQEKNQENENDVILTIFEEKDFDDEKIQKLINSYKSVDKTRQIFIFSATVLVIIMVLFLSLAIFSVKTSNSKSSNIAFIVFSFVTALLAVIMPIVCIITCVYHSEKGVNKYQEILHKDANKKVPTEEEEITLKEEIISSQDNVPLEKEKLLMEQSGVLATYGTFRKKLEKQKSEKENLIESPAVTEDRNKAFLFSSLD